MSGTQPRTHSKKVSRLPPPTLQSCRVRSRAAAEASGSPLSSPIHSSGGQAPGSPLESPLLTAPQLPPDTSSQGATSSCNPVVLSSGPQAASKPIKIGLDDQEMSDAPAPSDHDKDVVMESALNRDLAKAICVLAARLPKRGHAKESVDAQCTKNDAATSDGSVVMAFPPDFQSDICKWIHSYHGKVETLANARSLLTKLCKHVSAKTFPTSLSSIKVPLIQFSHAFLSAPAQDADHSTYNAATGPVGFEPYISAAVQALKEGVLKDWVSEKTREVAFLEH